MTVSLPCSPETITALFVNPLYTPIQSKKLKKKSTAPPSHGGNNAINPQGKLQYIYLDDVIILSIRE